MAVRLSVDGKPVMNVVAKDARPTLSGAPNKEHGFHIITDDSWVQTLGSAGKHRLDLYVFLDETPSPTSPTAAVEGSPLCFVDGKPVPAPRGVPGNCDWELFALPKYMAVAMARQIATGTVLRAGDSLRSYKTSP
jgi:hypothetical protein